MVTVQDFPKSESSFKVAGWSKAEAMTPGRWTSQKVEVISEARGQLPFMPLTSGGLHAILQQLYKIYER